MSDIDIDPDAEFSRWLDTKMALADAVDAAQAAIAEEEGIDLAVQDESEWHGGRRRMGDGPDHGPDHGPYFGHELYARAWERVDVPAIVERFGARGQDGS